MYKRAKNSWTKHIDFIMLDLLCLHFSFLLAFAIRHYALQNQWICAYSLQGYRMIGIIMTMMQFIVGFFTTPYSGILRRTKFSELNSVVLHNVTLLASVFAYIVFMQMGTYISRLTLLLFCIINSGVTFAARTCLKRYINTSRCKEKNVKYLLVVTTNKKVESIVKKINKKDSAFLVIGVVLLGEKKSGISEVEGVPVVAYTSTDAYKYACENIVDEVFINIPDGEGISTQDVADEFLRMGITVNINLEILESPMPNVAIEKMNGYMVMTSAVSTASPIQAFIKRSIDIMAGITGCMITGILYIFIAPIIKIADPGPVFFSQKRMGKNGRVFIMYKFRSMYQNAEERKKELMKENKMSGLMFKMDADPRIIGSGPDGTRKGLGYWMRTLSIDEFPNFYSILRGDMSLVGTRPPTLAEYKEYDLHHKSRLAIKPGLTGLWQVSGRSDITDFEEIVALDTEYIKRWSLSLDIRIILKTILVVVKRKGSV